MLKVREKALKQGIFPVHTGVWKKELFCGDCVEEREFPHNLNITWVWKLSKMWKSGLTQISR